MLKTRAAGDNVGKREKFIGYLIGPFFALVPNAIFTSFLNRFYTDILGMVGRFITLLPLVSVIFIAAGNIIMGILIDKTKSRMGKARPYLLVAAPIIALSCILMFSVPTGNMTLQVIWIAISYNLFFSIAYPCYSMAHNMMVPLSTRNVKERGGLSVVTNLANMGAAGFMAAMIFPMFVYPHLKNQQNWLTVMSVFTALALIGILLEFFYTKERITEETRETVEDKVNIPLGKQLKGIVTEKYWWMIILFYILFNCSGGLKNLSMSYYCDYIVGSFQDGRTQTLLAAVTGIPMGIGVFIAWPLANKFGKKNITVIGMIVAVLGGIISLMQPENFWMVVVGVTIKTFGTIPAIYVMMALFADVLDHLEYKNGYRSDGLSMSIFSVITVAAGGVMTALFNGLISRTGYQAPSIINGVATAVEQNGGTKTVFILSFLGAELLAYTIIAIFLNFLTVEKHIAKEQEAIKLRNNGGQTDGEE